MTSIACSRPLWVASSVVSLAFLLSGCGAGENTSSDGNGTEAPGPGGAEGTGGNGNGGSSSGGAATGGANTGGVSIGGTSGTGGDDTGGAAATGGAATGGASSAGGTETGGVANGGAAGSGSGGEEPSDTGGASTGGVTATGGNDTGGTNGTGGEATGGTSSGGTGGGPALEPCATVGELGCSEEPPEQKLVCVAGFWTPNGSCAAGETCDPATGSCATISTECAGRQPGDRYCAGDELFECGPRLISSQLVESCLGLCDGDGPSPFCVAPVCGDGKQNQLAEECDDGGVPMASCVACQLVLESAHIVQLSSGGEHNCVLDNLGRVKCWGENGVAGKLGLGDTSHRGDNPNEMTALPFLDFGAGRTVKTLAVGLHHNCAILDDDSLKCWGAGGDGALGIGPSDNKGDAPNEMGSALPSVNLGAGRTAKTVAVGDFHTCAIADDDSLRCWGNNATGQLGQGNTTRLYAPPASPVYLGAGRTARAVSAGTSHTCALLDDFTVKCWGENGNGQLGIGDNGDRGLTWNQMLGLPTVSLGTGRTAKAISAGSYHSCALLDDDTIKCWGHNAYGQLGQGDTVQRGDAASELGDNLPIVALGSGRTTREVVTYDAYGTCALLDDFSVKCWGDNIWGQLGQGNTATRGDQANELGDNLPAINLGTSRTAQAIATGRYHVCALLDDDSVKCWGINSFGELGIGSTATRGNAAGQLGDNLLPLPLP